MTIVNKNKSALSISQTVSFNTSKTLGQYIESIQEAARLTGFQLQINAESETNATFELSKPRSLLFADQSVCAGTLHSQEGDTRVECSITLDLFSGSRLFLFIGLFAALTILVLLMPSETFNQTVLLVCGAYLLPAAALLIFRFQANRVALSSILIESAK
jgi:hypothetical protein